MPSKKPRQRLQDIVYNIDAIRRYTIGLDFQSFVTNELVVDAVERCLSRISEAATKLGSMANDLAPNQPWDDIRGLGNRLRHEYDIISRQDIWAIITDDIGSLNDACKNALEKMGNSSA